MKIGTYVWNQRSPVRLQRTTHFSTKDIFNQYEVDVHTTHRQRVMRTANAQRASNSECKKTEKNEGRLYNQEANWWAEPKEPKNKMNKYLLSILFYRCRLLLIFHIYFTCVCKITIIIDVYVQHACDGTCMHTARAREKVKKEKYKANTCIFYSFHGQTKQAMYKQFVNTINTRAINYEKQIFYTHTHRGINW